MFIRRESFKEYITYYPITAALIAINVVMVILMEIYGSSQSIYTLLRFGALYRYEGFVNPEWWRYITPIFLHGGWAHLLFNSFGLLVFAPPLERMLGKWRYIACYFISGIAGNLVSAVLHQDDFVSVGASGAIYGIYAAYIYLAIFRKDIMDYSSRKTIQTIVIIGVVYSILPYNNVDLWAHLGGFLGGFAFMALVVMSIKRKYRQD
jgi:rhomboid protease GluP